MKNKKNSSFAIVFQLGFYKNVKFECDYGEFIDR